MSNKYNGWTNYETWNFNLWITNTEGDYRHALQLTKDSINKYELSKDLKQWAEDMADDCIGTEIGFIIDIIYSSIKEVNFYEVAEHLWDEVHNKEEE
jgi:hypothetical protein